MHIPRTIALLLLVLAISSTAAAQSDLKEPSTIDPVAAAISADNPDICDEIGWGLLPEHLNDGVLIAPFAHYGGCHHGVGAVFFGGCIVPFRHADIPDRIPSGKAEVFCSISVTAVEAFGTRVDPADFYIVDYMDRSYGTRPETWDLTPALHAVTIGQEATAGGRLFFLVDDPLYVPFLLLWAPSTPVGQRYGALIIDNMVPWQDSEGF